MRLPKFLGAVLLKKEFVIAIIVVSTAGTFLLHFINLNSIIDSDEYFYRTAALTIINHTSCGPLVDLVSLQPCNLEHPPFAKLLMAASVELFGQGNLGVRIPSIIAGVLTIPTIAWFTWSLSGGNSKAVISATVLISISPTWFLLSSAGMLDTIELFFGILALAVYFSRMGPEKMRLTLSGILMGLSILSKEAGALILAGLMIYELFFGKWRKASYVLLTGVLTVFLGLWIYDSIFTLFNNPIQHALFIIGTGLRLKYQGGFLVTPVQWFFQEREILPVALCIAWVPAAMILIFRGRRASLGLLSFSVVFLLATLLPPAILYYIDQRQEYLFYEIQVIPALVLGSSGLLGLRQVPWYLTLVVALASILLFAFFFPSLRSIYF